MEYKISSVLEGITQKYKPKQIFVVTSDQEIEILKEKSKFWNIKNLNLLNEDNFFLDKYNLTKTDIVSQITQNKPNYSPGWLYQQIIKFFHEFKTSWFPYDLSCNKANFSLFS